MTIRPRISPTTPIGPPLLRSPCTKKGLAKHPPLDGRTDLSAVAGIEGVHCADGVGVRGTSIEGTGVSGQGPVNGVVGDGGDDGRGVLGLSEAGEGVRGETNSLQMAAVAGISKNPRKVRGGSAGVFGSSIAGEGVHGETRSPRAAAVAGMSLCEARGDEGLAPGIWGSSVVGEGVHGETHSSFFAAVAGISLSEELGEEGVAPAIWGSSKVGEGVHGESRSHHYPAVVGVQLNEDSPGAGTYGEHKGRGPGGFFRSAAGEGLHAETKSLDLAAITGIQLNPHARGPGIYAEHIAGGTAGFFRGNVIITGDCCLPGCDFAEDFTIDEKALAEPGTVMMLSSTGELVPCRSPYENKVVGVVAGAGSFRSGIIMDKQEASAVRRGPIALVGKVFCKVDAADAPIEVGDLLTSSDTPGHAMKASDSSRAFGAVIGKAMAPLTEGRGLIPILISLQ